MSEFKPGATVNAGGVNGTDDAPDWAAGDEARPLEFSQALMAEAAIAEPMARLRDAARSERSSAARKAKLLAEFDRLHRRPASFRPALAVAASVLVVLSAGLLWQSRTPPAAEPLVVASTQTSDTDEFVPVPYAPPLASGELVSVVRTELQASALDRMGFVVPGASGGEFDAEVMVGQDGLPRAVRVLADVRFEN